MQLPPLTFADASLLLAIGAVVLLITAEVASSSYGHRNLVINKKKLENAAIASGTLFLIVVAVRMIEIITQT